MIDYKKNIGKYKMDFSFSNLPPTEMKHYQILKDVGFNVAVPNEYQYGKVGEKSWDDILSLLEEVGFEKIRVTLSNVKTEGVDRLLKMDLRKHPKIYSVRFWDEPTYREIPILKDLYKRCESEYPEIIWTTNLLPDYIHFQDLGSPYRKYIDTFFEEIIKNQMGERVIWCDYYPFLNKNGSTFLATYLWNFDYFAQKCKEYDTTLCWHVQACNFFRHRDIWYEDISFQVLVALAFGVKDISFFNYAVPENHPDHPEGCYSLIDVENNPTHLYYDVQRVIREVRKVEHILCSFNYNGMKVFVGKNNTKGYNIAFDFVDNELGDLQAIKDFESCEDAVITECIGENDEYGYFVINYTDPYCKVSNKVKVGLKDGYSKTLCVLNGKEYIVDGTEIEIELKPGEVLFIVPQKA